MYHELKSDYIIKISIRIYLTIVMYTNTNLGTFNSELSSQCLFTILDLLQILVKPLIYLLFVVRTITTRGSAYHHGTMRTRV